MEANPNLMQDFIDLRPEDVNVNIGVGIEEGSSDFYMYDDGSGKNSFVKEEVKGFMKTIRLRTNTLNGVVEKYCKGEWPDFLSVDIEGLDALVLTTADFSGSKPKVICVEAYGEGKEEVIRNFLKNQGYFAICRFIYNLIFVGNQYEGVVR